MLNLTLKRYILKTIKFNNYKQDHRLLTQLPEYLNDTLIGLLLSDGGLEKFSDSSNVRLSVIMSMNNYAYVLHLYNLFEPYIDTDIKFLDVKSSTTAQNNKLYLTARFKTISMPQLLYYYNIFYKKNNNK
jgi:LAGLIDADG DNA endonuclease family